MTEQSENMMDLLKELAMLKELDEKSSHESNSQNDVEARQKRRQEITDQIKALGEAAG